MKARIGEKEKKFFLYVPPKSEEKAQKLLESNKIILRRAARLHDQRQDTLRDADNDS